MVENQNLIAGLVVKYSRGEDLTPEETAALEQWCALSEEHRQVPEQFRDPEWLRENLRSLPPAPSLAMWEELERRVEGTTGPGPLPGAARPRIGWRKPAFAAAVLVLVGSLVWLKRYERAAKAPAVQQQAGLLQNGKPLPAESRRAVVTRLDSSTVLLDTVADGGLVSLGDQVYLRKVNDNDVVYTGNPKAVQHYGWHRLTIGKQHTPLNLRLPDGSRVQLQPGSNAAATPFRDEQQLIRLEGEAWFDIARNSRMPLTVETGDGMRARVLGTCFAVKAPGDGQATSVSLLSGAVQVFGRRDSILLRPGHEAVMRGDGLVVQSLTEGAGLTAWSGTVFSFDRTSLTDAVREIARWYGQEVSNPAHVKGLPITGCFPKNSALKEILAQLEMAESGEAHIRQQPDSGLIIITRNRTH